jgi:rfaE bifunctional protein nucleotidyltransferase chain/domain|tara:strand:+ start:516 stop:911 length:396 start_codon:yes stop_codon:yes gene_type:complete
MQITRKIWVNGVFDVLHRGHIELFNFAKNQGGYLTVGIDADKRVKKSKGESRPVNNETDRKYFLEAIKYVDEVKIFNSDEQLSNIIKQYKPDCMVIGSDWMGKEVIGGQYAKELVYFSRVGNYSTSNILNK